MEILLSQRLLRVHTFKHQKANPHTLNMYGTEVRPKEIRSQPHWLQ